MDKEKKKSERKSNIEILRIFSIILIIMHHYALYSGFEFSNNITFNKIVVDFFSAFGKLGVAIFVIISGYFYDKNEFKIKKLLYLVFKVWIYSITGLAIGIIIDSSKLNTTNIIKSIMPTLFGLYWFSNCYILIYIFSPILKKILDNFEKREMGKYLAIMIIIWSFIAIIPKTRTFSNEFISLTLIYLMGGYIKKYNVNLISNKARIIYVLILSMVLIGIMLALEYISIEVERIKEYILYFNSLNSPLILAMAILIFNIFKNINIKNIKNVNILASTTFGIYLIHENVFFRDIIWGNIIQGAKYIESPLLIINAIVGVLLVFIVCFIIELIEQNIIQNRVMKLIDKINIKRKEVIK